MLSQCGAAMFFEFCQQRLNLRLIIREKGLVPVRIIGCGGRLILWNVGIHNFTIFPGITGFSVRGFAQRR